jgi:hypothetical protein
VLGEGAKPGSGNNSRLCSLGRRGETHATDPSVTSNK